MSVKKYSDYIALHEQKTKTIGFRAITEDVHVLDNEGETHVQVKGAKSVDELDDAIGNRLKKHHGFTDQEVKDHYHDAYYSEAPFHHEEPEPDDKVDEVRTKTKHVNDIARRVADMKNEDYDD